MSFARRIVIDTGILISAALRPESVPALALEKALLHFEVCASVETLVELESVLLRDKFDRYAPVSLRQAFVSGLRSHLAMIDVRMIVIDCADPKDNKFLALAETCGAEMIIASDADLIALHPWRDIPILPPSAFLVAIR